MAGTPLSAPREMRFRWYRQVEQYDKTVGEVCDIFGVSRKTYYKWYRRDHGLEPGVKNPGRHTHSSRLQEW
ncbi:MAG: helix-turn-helix domain-containing protein [Patescibacteria group bacterium]